MWPSKRHLRAPALPDHALCAIFIVGAWGSLDDLGLRRRPLPSPRGDPRDRRAAARPGGSLYHLQKISRKSASRFSIKFSSASSLSSRLRLSILQMLPALAGSSMEVPMHNVTRIVTAALAAV